MITYVITDGRGNYATQNVAGRYFPVCSFEGCAQFDSYGKAKNILKSCLGKGFNKYYHVEEIAVQDEEVEVLPATLPAEKRLEQKADTMKVLVDEPEVENIVPQAYEALATALRILEDANSKREFLLNRQCRVDQEISDIEHYTEFSDNLNVYQGWLAYKLLKKRLEERRIIKDELQMLGGINETIEALRKAVKQIEGMNSRQYTPRVLRELFA